MVACAFCSAPHAADGTCVSCGRAAGPTPPWPSATDEHPDRANAVVLVVVSALVALGIVAIALLAVNELGPDPGAIPGAAAAPDAVEVVRGR